jgi:hypothetical protein
MHLKVLTICVIICTSSFIGRLNPTAFSEEDHEKILKYFENCIFREISKCESKLALLATSKSKHLKDYAAMESQKAAYLKAEREMLIKWMLEMQLEPKHYKVEVFLTSRFHEQNQ